MTFLATVRHTGTRFTRVVLESRIRLPFSRLRHIEPGNEAWLDEHIPEHLPLILTMRHPMRVTRTWRRMGWEIDETYLAAWRLLFEYKSRFDDSFWMPVDATDRASYLNAIGKRLGVDFVTTWEPLGVTLKSRNREPGLSDSACLEFFRTLPFAQFGYAL